MNQSTVVFDLGTILSITDGKLLTSMDNVYEILNYMTGDDLYTHQLIRASQEMKPIILEQYPDLVNVDTSSVNRENWQEFLNSQIEIYGNGFPIIPCGLWQHQFINPQEEMESMMKGREDRIFIVNPESFSG